LICCYYTLEQSTQYLAQVEHEAVQVRISLRQLEETIEIQRTARPALVDLIPDRSEQAYADLIARGVHERERTRQVLSDAQRD
jgi:hypothetical protein